MARTGGRTEARRAARAALWGVLLLGPGAGCPGGPAGDCAEGSAWDEAADRCLPDACIENPLGRYAESEIAAFVAPGESIQDAVDSVMEGGGGVVFLRPGTHLGPVEIAGSETVALGGACADAVTLSGAEAGGDFVVTLGGPDVELHDVTVEGGARGALVDGPGSLTKLTDVRFTRNRRTQLLVRGDGTRAELTAVEIIDAAGDDDDPGRGLVLEDAVEVAATGMLFARNQQAAVLAEGGVLVLEDSEILDTAVNGGGGSGLVVLEGADVTARNVRVAGSEGYQVLARGAGGGDGWVPTYVTLEDVQIEDGAPCTHDHGCGGIVVTEFAEVFGDRVTFARNQSSSILVADRGELTIRVGEVRESLAVPGIPSAAVQARRDGTAYMLMFDFYDNEEQSLTCSDGGWLLIEGSTMTGTTISPDADRAAIEVANGGTFLGNLLEVVDNEGPGVLSLVSDDCDLDCSPPSFRLTRSIFARNGRRAMEIQSGEITLQDMVVEDNQSAGVRFGVGAAGTIETLTVRGTVPGELDGGTGMVVLEGAQLTITDLLLEDNAQWGLHLSSPATNVEITRGVIRGTRPINGNYGGAAVALEDGARLVATDLLLEDNAGGILAADQSRVVATDLTIRETVSPPDVVGGMGIFLYGSAELEGAGVIIENTAGPGIFSAGGVVALEDFRISAARFAGVASVGGELFLSDGAVSAVEVHPSEAGGVGVYSFPSFAPPTTTVTDVDFSDLHGPAVYMRAEGALWLEASTITTSGAPPFLPGGVLAREGVGPWTEDGGLGGGPAGLMLAANVFRELTGDAVVLDESSATFGTGASSDNLFESLDGEAVRTQRCGAVPDPVVQDATVGAECRQDAIALGPALGFEYLLFETEAIE